jgi:lipopolysaccharide biosynthesis regulator YciM
MNLWLLLLFFIAIATGFTLGRIDYRRRQKRKLAALAGDYAKGINFLLNEQPDKAVDVLLDCLDVNEDTLETHLSLARVFRRRGEMDRATRIHESLLSVEGLSQLTKDDIAYELALDFLVGGLFDRAEQLFMEMVENRSRHRLSAMRHLMQIFEQEKDWNSALAIGEKLLQKDGGVAPVLAHYCCELADDLLHDGINKAARRTLRRALYFDRRCARAWLLRGQLETAQGMMKAAYSAYLSLYRLDGELFDEVLPLAEAAFREHAGETEWLRFLADACIAQPSTARVLRLASGLEEYYGEEEAAHLLGEYMKENPSVQGLDRFIDLKLDGVEEPVREYLHLLRRLTQKLPSSPSQYQCTECGFNAKTLYWQCPSCKKWGSVRPRTSLPQHSA